MDGKMKFYLLLIFGAGASYAIVGPASMCTCDTDTVLYQLAISGSPDDALCRFGCIFLSCIKKCKLPGGGDLQKAIDAKCGGGTEAGGKNGGASVGESTGWGCGQRTGGAPRPAGRITIASVLFLLLAVRFPIH